MHPSALLIDLDGVIRFWSNDDSHIEAACDLPPGAIRRIAFAPEFLLPAVCGVIPDEVWRANILTELRRLHPASNVDEAVAKWSASHGETNREVLDVIAQCRPDLRVILATNATSRLPADLRALRLDDRFHAVANSSEFRVMKPQAEFYASALKLAAVEPGEALYVDDSLPNIDAAAQLGIRSHHFADPVGLLRFLRQSGAMREQAP
ncbi:MAG: HAD-IA family hydrolase [Rudaea sp.]|uniref:HAD-IA family hydrolase n=1 Tax=Rudaea sp. TaxID=2136325 RepID=UPI0039E6B2F4